MINDRYYNIEFGKSPNPFISLVENRTEKLKLCTFERHNHMKDHFDCEYINNKEPMWIQNIHGSNASNRVKGRLIKNFNKLILTKQFGLNSEIKDVSYYNR